jgi:predicted Zn-dependent protease
MQWALIVGLCCWLGCSTTAQVESLSTFEVQQMSQDIGVELAKSFEKHLKFVHQPEVVAYLTRMGVAMMSHQESLQGMNLTIKLIRAQNKHISCYALPGVTLYCPVELLKVMESDNEVAAVLAIQLAHVMNHDFLKNLEIRLHVKKGAQIPEEPDNSAINLDVDDQDKLENKLDYRALWIKADLAEATFFKNYELFHFLGRSQLMAVRRAVQLMYQAGYDPRGGVRFFEYLSKPDIRSSYDADVLERAIETIREEISKYVPLKNPIIRTLEFYKIQKKVMSL